jgi:hypothetical protein
MLAFPVIALAVALIAIGRGAMGGQLLEYERKRDRYARYFCFTLGIVILVGWLFYLVF